MSTPATNKQVPDNAILDAFNKQTYLGNQFKYGVSSVEIASTSEIPLLLLSNPAISSTAFPSNYKSLFVNYRKMICITSSETAIFRYYVGPTVTAAGSVVTPVNMRPANLTTAVGVLTTSPTVSSNGILTGMLSSNAFVEDRTQELLILDPGQNMLVTIEAGSTTTFIGHETGWYEL